MENKHLTFNEIMDFISVKKLNAETEEIINRVNLHIIHCEECRNLVRSFQKMKNDFAQLTKKTDGCINEILTNDSKYMDGESVAQSEVHHIGEEKAKSELKLEK